jgi:hypothetical protein
MGRSHAGLSATHEMRDTSIGLVRIRGRIGRNQAGTAPFAPKRLSKPEQEPFDD